MSVVASDAFSLTLTELKEILKSKGLSLGGNKAELIDRLAKADPTGKWLRENDGTGIEDITVQISTPGSSESANAMSPEREIALYKREKELAERELALVHHENQLLRERQLIDERRQNLEVSLDDAIMNSSAGNQERTNDDRTPEQCTNGRASISTKVNMTMLADLLSPFSGNAEKYETCDRQLMFLKQTYNLEDDILRILIGTRLKGRAMEWFHSKPIYIAMPSDDLLAELRKMFHHRPNKITMRRRFEERVWTKT